MFETNEILVKRIRHFKENTLLNHHTSDDGVDERRARGERGKRSRRSSSRNTFLRVEIRPRHAAALEANETFAKREADFASDEN